MKKITEKNSNKKTTKNYSPGTHQHCGKDSQQKRKMKKITAKKQQPKINHLEHTNTAAKIHRKKGKK